MKPPVYGPKALEQQFLNGIVTLHDGICGCNTPFDHAKFLIEQTKCPGTSEETTLAHGDVDNFDDGDLARLFDAADAGDDG